jgi:hypothetical protein
MIVAWLAWICVLPFVLFVGFNWFIKRRPLKGIFQEIASMFALHVHNVDKDDWALTVLSPEKSSWMDVDLNPGMIVRHGDDTWDYVIRKDDPKQRLFVCFRRCFLSVPIRNQTWMYELCAIGRPRMLLNDSRLEDARLFSYDQQLYASVDMIVDMQFNTKQVVVPIRLNNIRPKIIKSSLNDYVSNIQTEKNWQFFEDHGKKYVVYTVQPLRIFELVGHDLRPVRKVAEQQWTAPDKSTLRCGTPPVFIHDRFYMVTHSKDYKMYIVTFDRSFRMIGCTRGSLINNLPGHYIHFPCGLVYDERKDTFLVSTGINNKQLAILEVQKRYVDGLLRPVF